jgi:hypothetical protein
MLYGSNFVEIKVCQSFEVVLHIIRFWKQNKISLTCSLTEYEVIKTGIRHKLVDKKPFDSLQAKSLKSN